MDVVLLTLTTLSLAAAAGFGFLSWRVGHEQRQREQARVAALATAMGGPSTLRGREIESPLAPRSVSDVPSRSRDAFPSEAEAHDTQVAVGSMFDRATEGLRGRPAIKAAVVGAMAVTIVIGAVIGARMSDASASPAATRRVSAPMSTAAPLELMSMRYQRDGTTLTVSGLVHNPPQGVAMNGVTAVVFAFDRNGGFIASGRAALDFGALAPGDESPFVVSLPNVTEVARYRVTFRNGSGVVRHIDRRGNQAELAHAVR